MDVLGPSRLGLLGLLGLAALACGGRASLDLGPGSSSGAPAHGSTTGEATGSTTEVEPPLVLCDPECSSLLPSTWTYEGDAGTRRVVEMRWDEDGSIVLGTQRVDGEIGLVRLSPDGEHVWTTTPALADAELELRGFDLHPSGDIVISATARPDGEGFTPTTAVLARFDVAANALAWTRETILEPGLGARPRAGSVVVLDDDLILQTCVNGYPEGESLVLREFDGHGELMSRGTLVNQPGTGDGPLPVGVRSPNGELLVSYHWWDSPAQQMSAATWRMVPPVYVPLSLTEHDVALDELAVDSIGRRVELAHGRSDETVTWLLSGWRSSGALRWQTTLPIITTSDTRPALAIGPDDDVYVAARATPRPNPIDPFVVLLEVARWSPDGELRWQSRRPLEIMATDDPVELLVDDDDGLIVGTVVLGRVYVERYEQVCACR